MNRALLLVSLLLFRRLLLACVGETVTFDATCRLILMVPSDAVHQERDAAEWLGQVLHEMTGADCQIVSEGSELKGVATIWMGDTSKAKGLWGPVDPLHRDCCEVSCSESTWVMRGNCPQMTLWGVSFFLEKYADVHLLMPGSMGAVIPKKAMWALPTVRETWTPAYESCQITGLTPAGVVWAERKGFYNKWDFNHALYRIFTAKVFDAHPEYFEACARRALCFIR